MKYNPNSIMFTLVKWMETSVNDVTFGKWNSIIYWIMLMISLLFDFVMIINVEGGGISLKKSENQG